MSVFSKLSPQVRCQDVVHIVHPEFCFSNAILFAIAIFKYSLNIYTKIYLATSIFKKHKMQYFAHEFIPDVFRSALFLPIQGFSLAYGSCLFRKYFTYNYATAGLIPILCGSLFAILMELKTRRKPLAIYTSIVAAEVVYQKLLNANRIRPIKNLQLFLFVVSLTSCMWFFAKSKYQRFVNSGLRKIFGSEEVQRYDENEAENWLTLKCANHEGFCAQYIAISGFVRPFLIGLITQTAAKIVLSLLNALRSASTFKLKLILNSIRAVFTDWRSLIRLGQFLGIFSATFKSSQCLQRKLAAWPSVWRPIISGVVASSLSFSHCPNPVLLMTLILSRVVDSFILLAADSKLFDSGKKARQGNTRTTREGGRNSSTAIFVLIYALTTSFIINEALIQPQSIPNRYRKFLNLCTANYWHNVNRDFFREFFE